LKSEGVISTPYQRKHVLRPLEKYLVIATDGVWDSLEDQDAIDLCVEGKNTKEMAKSIVKSAIDKGSKDNICCLVMKF
jgi:serine/threonine protein phosphatase PrpC